MTEQAKPAGCGTCTLCCKVMRVADLEPVKERGTWCRHCEPGRGCGIYADRPESCRVYECAWLLSQSKADTAFPAELRPDRCKVVFQGLVDRDGWQAFPDPGRPNAWREGIAAAFIERSRKVGLGVVVMHAGDRRTLLPGAPQGRPVGP